MEESEVENVENVEKVDPNQMVVVVDDSNQNEVERVDGPIPIEATGTSNMAAQQPNIPPYSNVSLNKMFLYTGELDVFINMYIKPDIHTDINIVFDFLHTIYEERANSGIDVKHDFETVQSVTLSGQLGQSGQFQIIFDQVDSFDYNGSKYVKQNLINSLYCLAYADFIHNNSQNNPQQVINTLFLNPFFFPFHRAFIMMDGIHDLEPRCSMTQKFWNKLTNTKDYRNREDLRSAIVNTAIKPHQDWCDDISKPYIDKWDNLSAKGGHSLLESYPTLERKIANVIIPRSSNKYSDLFEFNKEVGNNENIIYKVGDSSKLEIYAETPEEKNERVRAEKLAKKLRKKNGDDDEEGEVDCGGKFTAAFAPKMKSLFFEKGQSFAVSDCPGPNSNQYEKILGNKDKNVISIVSGTLDSSVDNNNGLEQHLSITLAKLDYKNDSELCILLPEASILEGLNIKEVMQRIVIGKEVNNARSFTMSFELWTAPSIVHCPMPIPNQNLDNNVVVIDNDDKCPGVNETIQYIFSKFGVKNQSLLKAGSCCLFGFSGSGEKLNADEKTNMFLDKYYDVFSNIGLEDDMNEIGGCLFRAKTMGDFYRLSDTALIQYLLKDKGQALLGTCDGYNAINSYASKNLTTIYGTPHHRFECYSPFNTSLTPAQKTNLDIEKKKRTFENKKQTVVDMHELIVTLKEKLGRQDSKIRVSISNLLIFFKENDIFNKLNGLIDATDVINTEIQTVVIDETAIEKEFINSRTNSICKHKLEENKIYFSTVIQNLKQNVQNKINVTLAMNFLFKALKKIEYIFNVEYKYDLTDLPTEDIQMNEYITKYSLCIKILELVNSNVLDTFSKDDFFKNNPELFTNYSDYVKQGKLQNQIYKNSIKEKNPKEMTNFYKLYKVLCAIAGLDSQHSNFQSLLEVMYNNWIQISGIYNTYIGTITLTEILPPINSVEEAAEAAAASASAVAAAAAAAAIPSVSLLYIPGKTDHIKSVKNTILDFYNFYENNNQPPIPNSGGGKPFPDNFVFKSSAIYNEIYKSIGESISKKFKLLFPDSSIQVQTQPEISLTNILDTISDNIFDKKNDFIKKIFNDDPKSIDSYYYKRKYVSRQYIDFIDLLEYLLNDDRFIFDPKFKFDPNLIKMIDELNNFFIDLNRQVIRYYIQKKNLNNYIEFKKNVKYTFSNRIIRDNFYDLIINFLEIGILYEYDNNQIYFYYDAVEEVIKYLPVKDLPVKDNDPKPNLFDIMFKKYIDKGLGNKFTLPEEVKEQIMKDYPYFNFASNDILKDAENKALNNVLSVIYLNNYNTDFLRMAFESVNDDQSIIANEAASKRTRKASQRAQQAEENERMLKLEAYQLQKSLSKKNPKPQSKKINRVIKFLNEREKKRSENVTQHRKKPQSSKRKRSDEKKPIDEPPKKKRITIQEIIQEIIHGIKRKRGNTQNTSNKRQDNNKSSTDAGGGPSKHTLKRNIKVRKYTKKNLKHNTRKSKQKKSIKKNKRRYKKYTKRL